MMTVFEMIVAIVGISCLAGVINTRIRTKHAAAQRSEDDEAGGAAQRLSDLEERVRVLERIVTDRNFDLKREFDELDRTP